MSMGPSRSFARRSEFLAHLGYHGGAHGKMASYTDGGGTDVDRVGRRRRTRAQRRARRVQRRAQGG